MVDLCFSDHGNGLPVLAAGQDHCGRATGLLSTGYERLICDGLLSDDVWV